MIETKANQAIVVRLGNVRPHPNADRLKLATVLGSQIVVGLDAENGDLGIYFDSNLQLSEAFATANDLVRRKDENGKPAGGMFDPKRRVKTQTFRGEKSDGFFTSLKSLEFAGAVDTNTFVEGYEFDTHNGIPICNKYVAVYRESRATGVAAPKKTKLTSPMFAEHYDTPHLVRQFEKIPDNALIFITEKDHGTSQRYGHVQVTRPFVSKKTSRLGKWLERITRETMSRKIVEYAGKLGIRLENGHWEYLIGTRRVVLDSEYKRGTGYHDDSLRDLAVRSLAGNLKKGETFYFEVVGYEPNGVSIMPSVDTTVLKDKAFTKKYGNMLDENGVPNGRMVFSYGQKKGEHAIRVYRITMTNEDGYTIEYPFDSVIERCKELGVDTVKVIGRYANLAELAHEACIWDDACDARKPIDARDLRDLIFRYVEHLSSGPSLTDSTHIKEGICLRWEKGLTHGNFKHKSFEFKVVEGIIKDAGVVDMEEQESVVAEENED